MSPPALPPPVMIDNHGGLGVGDQHVVLDLGHVRCRRCPLLKTTRAACGFEDCARLLYDAVKGGGHPGDHPVNDVALDLGNPVARIDLVPTSIEVVGYESACASRYIITS